MEFPPELKKTIAASRVFGASLVASLVVYFLVVEIVKVRFRPFLGFARMRDLQTFRYAVFAVAVGFVILNRVVNGILLRISADRGAEDGVRVLNRASSVSLILAEVPALLGLVLFFVGGLDRDFDILVFVSLVLVFMYFPRESSWIAFLEKQPSSCRF